MLLPNIFGHEHNDIYEVFFSLCRLVRAFASHDHATVLQLSDFIVKAVKKSVAIPSETMGVFNIVLKPLTKVVDILNSVLETLSETMVIQVNTIKTWFQILIGSVNALVELLNRSMKTLVGIISSQNYNYMIETAAEIPIEQPKPEGVQQKAEGGERQASRKWCRIT